MLITGAPDVLQEVVGDDLHVAGEDDQVDVALQQAQMLGLRLLLVAAHGDVEEGDAELAHVLGEVGVVGDDHRDVHVELSAAVTPEQLEQAVIRLRREDRHPLALCAPR